MELKPAGKSLSLAQKLETEGSSKPCSARSILGPCRPVFKLQQHEALLSVYSAQIPARLSLYLEAES